jgi:hypothetical protein
MQPWEEGVGLGIPRYREREVSEGTGLGSQQSPSHSSWNPRPDLCKVSCLATGPVLVGVRFLRCTATGFPCHWGLRVWLVPVHRAAPSGKSSLHM